jgi:hypothetical protein
VTSTRTGGRIGALPELMAGTERVHGSVFQPSPKRRLVDDQDELEEP